MPISKRIWTRWMILAAAAIPAAAASADPLVLQSPAQEPVVLQSGPVTALPPASQNPLLAVPADKPAGGDRILVVPFQPSNPNDVNPWLGRSIEKSLSSDLLAAIPGKVAVVDHPVVDNDAALTLARQTGARYVVVGDFTSTPHDLRITGQVLDASSGQAIAGLKVTGDTGQIFRMEDGLAAQLKSALGIHGGPTEAPLAASPAPISPNPGAIAGSPPADSGMIHVPSAPAPSLDGGGLRSDYSIYANGQTPYYSIYAATPAVTAYGADSTPYIYTPSYPSYDYGDYDYADVGYPSYGWPYGFGLCYPYGFGYGISIGGYYGNGWHHYNHSGYGHGGHGYRGNIYGSGGRGDNYNYAYRTGRGSGVTTYTSRSALGGSFYRGTSYAPYRAQPFYSRGTVGSRSNGFSFRSPSYHSFGGAAGHAGGGFHSGGAARGGGGHR